MAENLPPGRVHGPEQRDGIGIHALEAVQQPDRDGEERRDDHQHDLRLQPEAHPQHEQGGDGDRRNRLRDDQQRKNRLLQRQKAIHQEGQPKGQQRPDRQTRGRLLQGDQRVPHEIREVGDEGLPHV